MATTSARDFQVTVHRARAPRPLDPARPRVDVLVLNWNGLEHLVECLDSLRAVSYPSLHVVVLDQGSTDGSVQAVLADYPEATLLAIDRNVRFCLANNVGIDWSLAEGAQYVFVLNNDTTVFPDCIDKLVELAESDPQLGIVSPLNYRYYNPEVVDLGVRINWWNGGLHSIRRHEVPPGTQVLKSDYTWGCAMLISRAVLERIGGFDPRYVMYHEDADLCLRARHHGYLTVTRLDAAIRHKLTVTNNSIYLRQHYFRMRNLWLLGVLHAPFPAKLAFVPMYFLYQLPRQLAILVYNTFNSWRARPGGRRQMGSGQAGSGLTGSGHTGGEPVGGEQIGSATGPAARR